MSKERLLTAAEVADRFGVDVRTVARWANAGILPTAYKVPGLRGARLFHPDDVDTLNDKEKSA